MHRSDVACVAFLIVIPEGNLRLAEPTPASSLPIGNPDLLRRPDYGVRSHSTAVHTPADVPEE